MAVAHTTAKIDSPPIIDTNHITSLNSDMSMRHILNGSDVTCVVGLPFYCLAMHRPSPDFISMQSFNTVRVWHRFEFDDEVEQLPMIGSNEFLQVARKLFERRALRQSE